MYLSVVYTLVIEKRRPSDFALYLCSTLLIFLFGGRRKTVACTEQI